LLIKLRKLDFKLITVTESFSAPFCIRRLIHAVILKVIKLQKIFGCCMCVIPNEKLFISLLDKGAHGLFKRDVYYHSYPKYFTCAREIIVLLGAPLPFAFPDC